MSTFPERLKQLRTEKELSQQFLANQLGISKSSINMYERGEREPSFETLELIADYFNVDMNYLLGKSSSPCDFDIIGSLTGANSSIWEQMNSVKNKLKFYVSKNPSCGSGEKVYQLFKYAGFDPHKICHEISIDIDNIDAWMSSGLLPPKPIIDRIVGMFHLRISDLLDDEEFKEYCSHHSSTNSNSITISRKDCPSVTRILTDDQINAIQAILNQMP